MRGLGCCGAALWLCAAASVFAFRDMRSGFGGQPNASPEPAPPGPPRPWYWYNQHKFKRRLPIKRPIYKLIRKPPTEETAWHDPYLRRQVQGYERLIMGKRAWNRVKKAEMEEQFALKGDQDADGVNDIVWATGVVTNITREGVQVELDNDLGAGLIRFDELSLDAFPVAHDVAPIGSTVRCEHIDTQNKTAILSLKRPILRKIWQRMHEFRRQHRVTRGLVTKTLLTGVVVRFWGFHAVIPRNEYQGNTEKEAVGKVIDFRFRYVHWNEQRIIGSQRGALLTVHQDEFKMGSVISVVVNRVSSRGVQCSAKYGIPAFIPLAEISHFQTSDPREVFTQDQVVYAMILHPNLAKGELVLSTKYLEPNPGDMLTNPKMVFERAPELASVLIPPVVRELERRKFEQKVLRSKSRR